MMTDDRKEAVIDLLNALVKDRVEYEELHIDAGNNYAHLPGEGGFQYGDGESRLVEWCEANGIDTGNIESDRLVDLVLDNFVMESQHQFYSDDSTFTVDSCPLGEIEIDIPYDEMGIEWGELMELAGSGETDFYLSGTGLAYYISDYAWVAAIHLDTMRELVADELEDAS